jgi:hypothetical protein
MGNQPVARSLPTQDSINREETHTDIHVSSRIRAHDPSVRASGDGSCLRPRGHCDRPLNSPLVDTYRLRETAKVIGAYLIKFCC